MSTPNQLTLTALVSRLAHREVSARAATEACLEQIRRVDGRLRAFLSYDAADALAQADAADQALAAGTTHAQRPLLGVPLALKDVIAAKDHRINEQIRAKEVRVIGKDRQHIGIMSVPEALRLAREAELDLVEISPQAEPPVAQADGHAAA